MIERCTAEQEVAGAIPGVANTRSLKTTEEEGATFAQKTALLLRGSIDNIQMVVPSPITEMRPLKNVAREKWGTH